MSPEQKEESQRLVDAVNALDDNTLLIALVYGRTYPNLERNSPLVRAVLENRLLTKISQETKQLTRINEESKLELKRLVDSSLVIEGLTRWLVGLTVALGILTLFLVLDVGNKFRLEYVFSTSSIDRATNANPPAALIVSMNCCWCGDTRPVDDFTSMQSIRTPGSTPRISLTPARARGCRCCAP